MHTIYCKVVREKIPLSLPLYLYRFYRGLKQMKQKTLMLRDCFSNFLSAEMRSTFCLAQSLYGVSILLLVCIS